MPDGGKEPVTVKFFDINFCAGRPLRGAYRPAVTRTDILAALDKAGISNALVWHVAQLDSSPQEGNSLAADIATDDRLHACWTILPPQTEEVVRGDFFGEMARNGAKALRAFPNPHQFLLNRVVFGGFLDEVSDRRVPLLVSVEPPMNWTTIYALLQDYPNLTCVLCDLGVWGQDRHTWPLLEAYPNVYIETSCLSIEAGGLQATVNKYGADRLLFGAGFPKRYPEAAVLDLLHADISDSDRETIAWRNADRLMSEVRL